MVDTVIFPREQALILIIEDDSCTRQMLRGLLEQASCTVAEATDGEQGLDLYERLRPDLVLLDIMLPGISGLTACKRLRCLPGGERLPILMMTALSDQETVTRAFAVGATDYLTKPIQTIVLYQRLGYLLRIRQAEVALEKANVELERRIEERTAELTAVNRKLRQEIIERIRAEAELKATLREKEVLLQEIHHRVKNNLQIISSLLRLHAAYLQDSQVADIFAKSLRRLRAMALAHEKIYHAEDLSGVNLAEYVENLASDPITSNKRDSASLKLEADDTYLDLDTAIPCGLIINELISNSLNHAFTCVQTGEIYVQARSNDHQQLTLIIGDNGPGLRPALDFHRPATFGLQLVHNLVRQLDGRIDMLNGDGANFKITFTLPHRSQEFDIRPDSHRGR